MLRETVTCLKLLCRRENRMTSGTLPITNGPNTAILFCHMAVTTDIWPSASNNDMYNSLSFSNGITHPLLISLGKIG